MKTTDWKNKKNEALTQLQENGKRIPLLQKKLVRVEAIGSAPRVIEFVGFREPVTSETIETPYLSDYFRYGSEDEDLLKHLYLILVSEDLPSAKKCAIQAANNWRMEQEENDDGFYYTE